MSTHSANPKYRALALIKDEHRSLAAVLHALQFLTRQAQEGRPPAQELLDGIAHYLLHFPEKLHHPAEDRWLFAPLRQKTQACDDVLDALAAEHADGAAREQMILGALNAYKAGAPGAAEALHQAVETYAKFYWAHMFQEESFVLPLAKEHLSEDEWQAAAEGFAANHDPMYGADAAKEFEALFKRIVYTAPAPIGLGG